MPDGTSRFSYKGKTDPSLHGDSTFSEYTVLPEISVAKITKEAPLSKASVMGCAVPTGIGAVRNTARSRLVPPSRSLVWAPSYGGDPGRSLERRFTDHRHRHQYHEVPAGDGPWRHGVQSTPKTMMPPIQEVLVEMTAVDWITL
jgi:hypothetical protein